MRVSGDSRVNEQISLTAIHNVWVRMHNRIANTLRRLNPRASAEDIFQVGRHSSATKVIHISAVGRHISHNGWWSNFRRYSLPITVNFPFKSIPSIYDHSTCLQVRHERKLRSTRLSFNVPHLPYFPQVSNPSCLPATPTASPVCSRTSNPSTALHHPSLAPPLPARVGR